ncbi:glycoside hydrolase [Venturia nashicola]|uniref:Glycoside hydrolase n=1 Tax=Venturia nashicola TaxID=86259 RepID=A0A4Z1PCE5_9PEZI|nr:glycoside hydrolase [Venturia nashicola]TLD29475.1 glycoside hydrolase [Venturia nashicola]
MALLFNRFSGLITLLCLFSHAFALSHLPLSTSGRDIIDNAGNTVTYTGVNWPGHMDAMIPEGLQYSSIKEIVSKIKSVGFNVVRLTFAVEMVDQIIEGGDIAVQKSFAKALGDKDGGTIWGKIQDKNPGLGKDVTRLKVFDAVAAECEKQGIMIHLDNHISKAKWCCNSGDDNTWFGDREFDAGKWRRAWSYMAHYTKSWPALASVGMRNELRRPDNNPSLKSASYNWKDWYTNMKSCAQRIQKANPNTIVFFSGLEFDTDLSAVTAQKDLDGAGKFRKEDFLPGKIALELHSYKNKAKDCKVNTSELKRNGWNALDKTNPLVLPVVMTEFGFQQDMATAKTPYAQCLKEFVEKEKVGWTYWVLSGSYYIRAGKKDMDETWALLNHDWSDWRSPEVMKSYFIPMIKAPSRQLA